MSEMLVAKRATRGLRMTSLIGKMLPSSDLGFPFSITFSQNRNDP
jgi:hypothetical protein